MPKAQWELSAGYFDDVHTVYIYIYFTIDTYNTYGLNDVFYTVRMGIESQLVHVLLKFWWRCNILGWIMVNFVMSFSVTQTASLVGGIFSKVGDFVEQFIFFFEIELQISHISSMWSLVEI